VVMTRLSPGRLVDEVEYVTSPGRAVGSVVTDRGVLTRLGRDARGETWTIASLVAAEAGLSDAAPAALALDAAVAALARDCPWPPAPRPPPRLPRAAPPRRGAPAQPPRPHRQVRAARG